MLNNRKLLEMKMVERDYTYQKLARALNVSVTTLTNKVNHELDFKVGESVRIADILDLNKDEYLGIFINKDFS